MLAPKNSKTNKIFIEKCRLCQEYEGIFELNNNTERNEKLQQFFPFIKGYNEFKLYLPNFICDSCAQKIEEIIQFINKAMEVNSVLENVLSNLFGTAEHENLRSHYISEPEKNELVLLENNIPKQCAICLKKFRQSKNKKSFLNHLKKKHNYLLSCSKCKTLSKCDITDGHTCREGTAQLNKGENPENLDDENNIDIIDERNDKKDLNKPLDGTLDTAEDETHLQMENLNLKPFNCLKCNREFSNATGLKRHSKTHLRSLVCTAEGCKKICTSNYLLKVHLLGHESKRPFLCVTCGKGFTTKNSLTCHEKIHLSTKSYHCEPCNIGFSVRSNFRAHEKKYHEGVRFYCSQCTKEFLTKCSLERHEKIHAGVKEFKCTECPSEFYTNKELLKHQRYHKGLKPHKCEQCFKRFFERHHLVIHLRSHSGERPYKCKILGCEKSFVDSQKLKRHQSARHTAIT